MSHSVPTHIRTDKTSVVRGTYLSISDYGDMDESTNYDTEKQKHLVRQETSPANTTIYKSITHKDHQHHKFYKPISNRSWLLSLFLVAIAICIILLELAIRSHPDANTVPELGPRPSVVERRIVYVRQAALSNTTGVSTDISSSTTGPGSTSTPLNDDTQFTTATPGQPDPSDQVTITTTSQQGTGAPNPNDEITITTTSQPAPSAPNPNDQITITTSAISLSSPDPNNQITITSTDEAPLNDLLTDTSPTMTTTVGQPNADNGLTITTTGEGTGAPNPADQVTITTSAPAPGDPSPNDQLTVTSTPAPGEPSPADQMTITSGGTVVPQPTGNQQVSLTSNTAAGVVTLAGVASVVSGSLIVSGTGVIGTVQQAASASVVSGSLIVSGSSVLATVQQSDIQGTSVGALAVGHVTLTNSDGIATATVAFTGNVVVTGADGKTSTISYNNDIVLTNSKGVATKTLSDAVVLTDSSGSATKTLSYAAGTVLTNSDGVATKTVLYTGVATQAANAVDNNGVDSKGYRFTKFSYFLAVYLPNVLGVFLQSAWLIVFMTFKLMEPFYRLASPGGASAQNTLLADYMTAGLSASVFKTAAEGHWVLILVGLVQLFLAISMIFVSGSMKVVPTAYCKTTIALQQPCAPVWVINISMVRILEVCLVACFSMIIMIIYLNHNRVSGVYSDPSRISTVADILVHKPLIHEIRDIPSTSGKKDVSLDLRDNRYMLGTFFDNNREHYGIVKLNTYLDHTQTFTREPFYKSLYRHLASSTDGIADAINMHLPFLPDFLCMAFSLILFSIVLAYFLIKSGTKNAFNDWMNSNDFGPSVLLTTLGVIMGFLVKRKERYFRLSHSYVILSKGPTLASEAVTQSTHTSPFDSVYHASRNGNISLVLLALSAILSDIILMMVPSIPFSPAQTRDTYRISTFVVLTLTGVIFAIITSITIAEYVSHQATGSLYSSHCPETLAAVLMRLCASRFVDEKNMQGLGPHEFGSSRDHDEMQKVRYEGVDGMRRYTYGVMEGLDGVQRCMVEEDVHAKPVVLGAT